MMISDLPPDLLRTLLAVPLAAVAGYGAGVAHFRALARGTSAMTSGDWGRALRQLALRLTLTLAVLAGAALAGGALPLLAAAGALWIGRARVLRQGGAQGSAAERDGA